MAPTEMSIAGTLFSIVLQASVLRSKLGGTQSAQVTKSGKIEWESVSIV